ncbi:hypothetical protein E2C01_097511 [Portunus trituberculatus]|uniref:Uncharacterized protein n=1 Tax=Portunus trituberculatus TaxID=210409 RepID=A0A5B7KA47_PORTR|nr:hypothetical protein [Portunus trituberculatus]
MCYDAWRRRSRGIPVMSSPSAAFIFESDYSLLVDAGFWPLDLRRQSSMLRCWFHTHRLPDSVPCLSILRDSRSLAYATRPSLPKPFGLRVANLMADLSIDPTPVLSFRLTRVGYWQLPVISLCPPAMDGKKDFFPALSHTRFLKHFFYPF